MQMRNMKKGLLLCFLVGIILITAATILFKIGDYRKVDNNKNSEATALSTKDNKKTDYAYEMKYQCYVELNNDIVECYNDSIYLYFKSKGTGETVQHKYNPNTVDMGPIFKQKYEELEKARKAANSEPKMEVDEDVIKLTDATERVYDLVGQIWCAYGGQEEYGKKTDKSKEELHKEFLNCVKEYDGVYKTFNDKFESESIEHMKKELDKYKEKGDMDSYYTLNVMIKSENIYKYFVVNNITNDNFFNMNLEEYNKLLDDFNKAYSDFKDQDIKGNSCHTETFGEFAQAYHSFANNIVNMVKNKTFDAGKLDAEPGLVAPDDRKDIQERLYFYIDRMVSDYNSIQLFKN